MGTAGQYVGVQFGYSGNSYQKGAIFFESQDGNARGKMYFSMNGVPNSSNASISDAALTLDYNKIVYTTSRLNVNGAADNSLFSLNNGGGTTYTNGFSPNASNYTGAITLGGGTTYVYTGSGAVTWTLPNPSGNNQIYIIKNNGSGAITLNAYSSNQLIPLSSTTGVSSITIPIGQTVTIQQDGSAKSYLVNTSSSSGTFAPTLTDVAGFGSGLTVNVATYQQVGNIVTVSMYVTATPTAGGSNSFTTTLPMTRIGTSTSDWVSGNSTSSQMSSGAGYVFANASATLATVYIPIGTTISTRINVTFSYTL